MADLAENRVRAKALLNHLGGRPVPHLIGADDVADYAATFVSTSPFDGRPICEVSLGGEDEIDRAAQAANDAFPEWAALSGERRRRILLRIADAIVARADEIAIAECLDCGQAYRFMAKAALRGSENFRFFADMAATARDGQALPSSHHLNITTRMPVGPVGIITPWNTPFMLATWKIAPALAAGCTVVHKPAELAPLSARLLAEICRDAGLPPGVLNLVNGTGEGAGQALTRHPLIRAIAFVGESRTGAAIMEQGAPTLKRVHFELGGKNPVIVLADADLERALDATVFMAFSLNGERCTAGSRLLIDARIRAEFEERLAQRVAALRLGDPLDPETEVGPLISRDHRAKVTGYIETGRNEGAHLAVGGDCPQGLGQLMEPALMTGVHRSMRIAREEVFGPVLVSIPFADEEEAIAIANDVDYGLSGYLWTQDMSRAMRMSNRLEAGMIWVNSENVRHLPTPFGGMKASGIGRDGGDWSFEFYMEQKNIAFAAGTHDIPRLGAGSGA